MKKFETLAEYLARGGAISKVPAVDRLPNPEVIRKTVAGAPAVILTLGEADLFYGEARKNAKAKLKSTLKIDLKDLPKELRDKYITKLKEEYDGEDYEEKSIEEEIDEDED